MMTSADIQELVAHPEQLSQETLYELRTQIPRYPYFQTLRLLYLQNLYLLHDASLSTASCRVCLQKKSALCSSWTILPTMPPTS